MNTNDINAIRQLLISDMSRLKTAEKAAEKLEQTIDTWGEPGSELLQQLIRIKPPQAPTIDQDVRDFFNTHSATGDGEMVTVPLVEWNRLNDLADELRKTAESRGRVIDRLKPTNSTAPQTFDQTVTEAVANIQRKDR